MQYVPQADRGTCNNRPHRRPRIGLAWSRGSFDFSMLITVDTTSTIMVDSSGRQWLHRLHGFTIFNQVTWCTYRPILAIFGPLNCTHGPYSTVLNGAPMVAFPAKQCR
jgi:hypothetical protein